MESIFPLIIPLFIVLFIALAVLGYYQRQKRIKELSAWAKSHGFSFSSSYDYDFDNRYEFFSGLRKGSGRYAYNIIRGTRNENNLTAFDYHYETHSTDSKGRRKTHHHYFSAVIIHTPYYMKYLFIRPEGFFDKVTEFFGADDIDFESAEFSRNFYVKAKDKQWSYDVIHQETIEFLLAATRYTIEFYGHDILIYRNSTFTTTEFEDAIGTVEGILNRLPDYLIREMKGEQ